MHRRSVKTATAVLPLDVAGCVDVGELGVGVGDFGDVGGVLEGVVVAGEEAVRAVGGGAEEDEARMEGWG